MNKNKLFKSTSDFKSIEERLEAGKELRKTYPRESLADYTPAPNRSDPISILEEQAKSRLAELVPIRYARMLTSPFAFLRGGAAIMAADLGAQKNNTTLFVQACGDMHIANFGVYASAERNLIFNINDFDETLPAPWEWDLKRMVSSIVAACRFLNFDDLLCEKAIREATKEYKKRMRKYAKMGALELWYSRINEADILETLTEEEQKSFKKLTSKARERTHLQVLEKLTDLVDDKYKLRINAPFIVRETHSYNGKSIVEALQILFESYIESLSDDKRLLLRQYHIVDAVRKVVGVGSVGTRCWVVFLEGIHNNDPLFLQIKEAQKSVLEDFSGASEYKNHGQRVVAGQKLVQGAPDIFLGWGTYDDFHFYVRQLRDMKGGAEFDPEKTKARNLIPYVKMCAWAMALAHAKSGDAANIAGYIGKNSAVEDAMVKFAFAYGQQTEEDFAALAKAEKTGRITVAANK